MAYYNFNRCEELHLSELEKFAQELVLNESTCSPPTRQWLPSDLADSAVYVLRYAPGINSEWPLLLQTAPNKDYRDEKVREIIKKIINITSSTMVGELCLGNKIREINMGDF
jgi:hypothetical protein